MLTERQADRLDEIRDRMREMEEWLEGLTEVSTDPVAMTALEGINSTRIAIWDLLDEFAEEKESEAYTEMNL